MAVGGWELIKLEVCNILSPLCLPISSRGPLVLSLLYLALLITQHQTTSQSILVWNWCGTRVWSGVPNKRDLRCFYLVPYTLYNLGVPSSTPLCFDLHSQSQLFRMQNKLIGKKIFQKSISFWEDIPKGLKRIVETNKVSPKGIITKW